MGSFGSLTSVVGKGRPATCNNSLFNIVIKLLNLVTWWSTVLLKRLVVPHLVTKSPEFYKTRRFITVSQQSSSRTCPEPHQYIPRLPIVTFKIRFNTNYTWQPTLFVKAVFSILGFHIKILYACLFFLLKPPPPLATYPHTTSKLRRSSLCSLLQPPVTSFLLGPNVFLSTHFSGTLSLCSFCNAREQVAYPYKTTGKSTFLCTVFQCCF